MSRINFMLSWVEHEKSFIASKPGGSGPTVPSPPLDPHLAEFLQYRYKKRLWIFSLLKKIFNSACSKVTLLSADFFQNLLFQKIISGTPSECQMVWIQIRTDVICLSWSWSKLFAKVISRWQKWPHARKELRSRKSKFINWQPFHWKWISQNCNVYGPTLLLDMYTILGPHKQLINFLSLKFLIFLSNKHLFWDDSFVYS